MVPPEILRRIFEYATSYQEFAFNNRTLGRFLLGITNVSSLWRETALGYPALWNSFIGTSGEGFSYDSSGKLLLSLLASNFRVSSSVIFNSIAPLLPRVSEIDLDLQNAESLRAFAFLPKNTFPVLEKMSIRVAEDGNSTPLAALSGTLLMRSVTLNVPSYFLERNIFPFISWNKLTELHIKSDITVSLFKAIMSQCLALCSASFLVELTSAAHDSCGSNRSPVTLPYLSVLRLCFSSLEEPDFDWTWGNISKIISYIELPALKRLTYGSEDFLVPTPSFDLTKPQNYNLGYLSILTLWRTALRDPNGLMQLLDTCTNLSVFILFLDRSSDIDPANIIHICAAQPFTKLRKFSLVFSVFTVIEVEAITESFSDLLRIWSTTDARRMEGLKLRLYLCHEHEPRDLDKMHAAMKKLQDQYFCVGENRYRVANNNNVGFSEFSFAGVFVTPDTVLLF
ncbi:hypothetical protein H0H81_012501 [Sphagnurus paluster]|uniref:F-box domain-containing protein n=1 Tax=Sphagnurus paluster TaxID=117069 RepID=A0A9P7FND1_9AGAR|nr:hypothetical protein H0H81_012501 [Sphagnurus paluster]